MKILILNGPNLNLLGKREPEIYGRVTLNEICQKCSEICKEHDVELRFVQSNYEGALIEEIHSAVHDRNDAIIINAAALSHTSIGIVDALKAFDGTIIEVHLSNINKREVFRKHSYISEVAEGCILGFGENSYYLALKSLLEF